MKKNTFSLKALKKIFAPKAPDPFNPKTHHNISLVAFLAWVGLGADCLSSVSYGPAEAFLALGQEYHLGIFIAIMTAISVFIIAISYNQVIALFPSGGGGYKVATELIGPFPGLVSGAGLIVDYFLTIAISIASGMDAIASVAGITNRQIKIDIEIFLLIILVLINLRGMKESIKFLMPVFVGFIVSHALIIIYGISLHSDKLHTILPESINETHNMARDIGWFATLSILFRAYSLGAGTYTGLEAVSNNVNMLREPRVKTGNITMMYMAISLSLLAGGIITLYILWYTKPVHGQTLNFAVFNQVLNDVPYKEYLLILLSFFEAAVLFVAANTGFLGGPAVLSNMASDNWVPSYFSELSERLVKHNGIVVFGVAAIFILLWTHGEVSLLVVLYSINVFLTFSISLFGLSLYWIKNRSKEPQWIRKLIISSIGFIVCSCILVITVLEKFTEGAWMTVLITGLLVIVGLMIKNHYLATKKSYHRFRKKYSLDINEGVLEKIEEVKPKELNKNGKTAIILVNKSYEIGLTMTEWIQESFPKNFENFVFVSVGVVDSENFANHDRLVRLRKKIKLRLKTCVYYCRKHKLKSTYYEAFGAEGIQELMHTANKVYKKYPNSTFFISKIVFKKDRWWNRLMHHKREKIILEKFSLDNMPTMLIPFLV